MEQSQESVRRPERGMISLREKIDAGARVGSQTRVPNLKSTEFRGMIGG